MTVFSRSFVRAKIGGKVIPLERGTIARINPNRTADVFIRCIMKNERLPELDYIRDALFSSKQVTFEMDYSDLSGNEKRFKGIGEIQRIGIYWQMEDAVGIRIAVKVWIQDPNDLIL